MKTKFMSPQTGSRRYTHMHLKWFMVTSVFIQYISIVGLFNFYFLFSFLRMHKKHKKANKRISYFFPLRCFLNTFFYFCSLICVFVFLLGCVIVFFGAFWCFLCFWCFLVLLVLFVLFGDFCAYKIFSLKKKSLKLS